MKSPAEPEVGPTPSECPRPEDVPRVEGSTADTPWTGTPCSLIFLTSRDVSRDGKISPMWISEVSISIKIRKGLFGEDFLEAVGKMQLAAGPGECRVGDVGLISE